MREIGKYYVLDFICLSWKSFNLFFSNLEKSFLEFKIVITRTRILKFDLWKDENLLYQTLSVIMEI